MSDEMTAEEQEAIDGLINAIAHDLATGASKNSIVKQLMADGMAEDVATQFVNNSEQALHAAQHEYETSAEGRRELASHYARHMLYGVLWITGGLIVTAVTYSAATGGGVYVVAWGAMLFGAIDFLRGFFGWIRYKV